MDMVLDFEKGFDLFGMEIETKSEPEWLQLNRQWTLDHPSVLFQKCPRSVLDGWVTCEDNITNGCNAPINSSESRSKKCFIDKIDIKSLVEDPDSFNIDSLFAETDDHCSSCESKSRKWDTSDELKLLRFINGHAKFNLGLWKKIALELGRSVNSVRIKAAQLKKLSERKKVERRPTIHVMISNAINSLPQKKATKNQIIEKIQEMHGCDFLKRWKESVSQILSMSFKKIHGVYKLYPNKEVPEYKKCKTMGDYIAWVLCKYGPLSRFQIKEKINEHFGGTLNNAISHGNLQTWEITFLKKLKTSKFIDSSSAKTFYEIS
jgi:hypothetical protein